jgi:hypothetical protein
MSRRTARQGVASLALVLTLLVVGAQPVAAADWGHASHFAGFWAAFLDTIPGARAAHDMLAGWFHVTEKPDAAHQEKADQGWGIDPNGNVTNNRPTMAVPSDGS